MFTLIECGQLARAALADGAGEVCAVFQRSAYLRLPGERYVCLGDASLGRGPLTGVVAEPHALRSLELGARLELRIGNAAVWSPAPWHAQPPHPATVLANLGALDRALDARAPRDALGWTRATGGSPLQRHARPWLRALDRWLAASHEPVPPAIHSLLGLGPGLTPSGDDYLAGALLALRAIGRDAIAERLWQDLREPAGRRTHAISRAHLAAAAAGQAHEALHLCVEQLLGNEPARWDDPLARLDGIGHGSGWDGLGGAVAVARSLAGAGSVH